MSKNKKAKPELNVDLSSKSTTRQDLGLEQMVRKMTTNSLRDVITRGGYGEDIIDTMNNSFAYKPVLHYDDYLRAYERQGIAKRIIDATVDFTWKQLPNVIDEEEDANEDVKINNKTRNAVKKSSEQLTEFEQGIYALQTNFPLLKLCKKADRLSCLGRFSLIVIGTKVKDNNPDNKSNLNDPSRELPAGESINELSYIRVFSEKEVMINRWEEDRSNPRYGLPTEYTVTLKNGDKQATPYQVHWSRCIHIAEDVLDNDVYGIPKLEPVFNYLQDLLKVVGGSAEMFWLGAYQGLVFNVKEGYELGETEAIALENEIQNYVDKLQRFMKTRGVDVESLSTPTADPNGNFDVIIKLISGSSSIPVRILIGAENGVYAGSTDQDTFFSYINSRRKEFADEVILRPFIDRLVDYGYIKKASNNEYYLRWEPLFEESKTEQLQNGLTQINILKAASPIGDPMELTTVEEVRELAGLPAEIPETEYEQNFDYGLDLDETFGASDVNIYEEVKEKEPKSIFKSLFRRG